MLKILLTSFISQFLKKKKAPLLCNILKLTEIAVLQDPSVAELWSSAKDVAQVTRKKWKKTSALQ